MLQTPDEYELTEIIEGDTKIVVPKRSLYERAPSKHPAFFNPRAKLNRDISILVYAAFSKTTHENLRYLEGLAGVGVRGIRVANEIKDNISVTVNDINQYALSLATKSANANCIKNFETVEDEVCSFFSKFSKRGERGSIVDIDPFGSPSKYFDCAIRATKLNGIFSCTATDLQVLHGIFPKACKRKYGGTPIKTEYSNEISIRLILGCLMAVASRLELGIDPLFVESEMHYYRTYVKITNKPDLTGKLGYILHCKYCGNRKTQHNSDSRSCDICGSTGLIGGPLWIGKIFDKQFVCSMEKELPSTTNIDKKCERIIKNSIAEAEKPSLYFTLDEVAAIRRSSPPKLEVLVNSLNERGYNSSRTSLNPTGFRTSANIREILEVFSSLC